MEETNAFIFNCHVQTYANGKCNTSQNVIIQLHIFLAVFTIKLMKGKALRKHSLHGKKQPDLPFYFVETNHFIFVF